MMVAYNFLPQLVPPILARTKRQTIRAIGRRRHAIPGETLQLYTGMRTKQCRLVGTAVCVRVETIDLWFNDRPRIEIGPRVDILLTAQHDRDRFARADGFPDWPAMLAFWRETHPDYQDSFTGLIIEWGGFAAAGRATSEET